MSADFGTRYRAIYLGSDPERGPLIAVASPLPAPLLADLQAELGSLPRQHIARESEIAIALRLLRGADETFSKVQDGVAGVPLLGDMLIEQGLLQRSVFESSMRTYRPDRHGRVGDYLVEQGVILRDVIERVVEQQHLMHAELSRARA
jgi:adsorption protein B